MVRIVSTEATAIMLRNAQQPAISLEMAISLLRLGLIGVK